MNKLLKLTGISMLAIMTANGANAAGYTCEELIEYSSCNAGYYLSGGCPVGTGNGFELYHNTCVYAPNDFSGDEYSIQNTTKENCNTLGGTFYDGVYCIERGVVGNVEEAVRPSQIVCQECSSGASCAGGTDGAKVCAGGTYQPNTGQSSCLTTPAGNYSGTGATNYTACSAGRYQPESGQSSCLPCPAGSYCATTGLTAASGLCADGTYALGGAQSCESCPATNLTDMNNAPVVAITGTTGATSAAACFIDPDTYFKDAKGTYHFKSNCAHQGGVVSGLTAEAACKLDPECEWYEDIDGWRAMCPTEYHWLYNSELGIGYCYGYNNGEFLMDNPNDTCDWGGGTWDWENKTCNCPEGTSWQYDGTDLICM